MSSSGKEHLIAKKAILTLKYPYNKKNIIKHSKPFSIELQFNRKTIHWDIHSFQLMQSTATRSAQNKNIEKYNNENVIVVLDKTKKIPLILITKDGTIFQNMRFIKQHEV